MHARWAHTDGAGGRFAWIDVQGRPQAPPSTGNAVPNWSPGPRLLEEEPRGQAQLMERVCTREEKAEGASCIIIPAASALPLSLPSKRPMPTDNWLLEVESWGIH